MEMWKKVGKIITDEIIYNSLVKRHAPAYLIKIIEPYLNEMWYTIDEGINNITFVTNGTIDQAIWETIWDTLSNEDVIIIRFYADDIFGHISFIEVYLIVDTSGSSGAAIPGYPLFLIIGIFTIALIFISRKIFREMI